MSAFLVSDKHIDAILTFARIKTQYNDALRYYYNGESKQMINLDEIGQILIDENYKSLDARYGDKNESHEYKYTRYAPFYVNGIDVAQVFKALDCYEYQACETGDAYYQSEANAIIEALRNRAIKAVPGYDDAQWEIVQ